MLVIPVLDLAGRRAVHARGGERSTYQPVRSQLMRPGDAPGDAQALVRAYRREIGHDQVYVADLDAIGGGELQGELLERLIAEGARVWLDAGVDSMDGALRVSASGVTRVIVGLETLGAIEVLREVCAALGAGRVVFSLDLRGGEPLARAAALRALDAPSLAALAADAGAATIILLDLTRVGGIAGPDLARAAAVRAAVPGVELLVGGGVRDAGDLARLTGAGVDGALVASALHEGRLSPRPSPG